MLMRGVSNFGSLIFTEGICKQMLEYKVGRGKVSRGGRGGYTVEASPPRPPILSSEITKEF